MLYGLEPGLTKHFERHGAYEMFQELKLVFHTHARVERYETSDSTLPTRWRRIAQLVSMCSEMSEYYNHLNQVGVNLPDKIVIDRVL